MLSSCFGSSLGARRGEAGGGTLGGAGAAAPGADAELISVPAAPPATEVKHGWAVDDGVRRSEGRGPPPGVWLPPGLIRGKTHAMRDA